MVNNNKEIEGIRVLLNKLQPVSFVLFIKLSFNIYQVPVHKSMCYLIAEAHPGQG